MSNVIELNGIVLTLSDDVMNKLFGELLVTQVASMQRQIDTMALTIVRLESATFDNETMIESLRTDVELVKGEVSDMDNSIAELDNKVEGFDAKFDDMPDLDDMAGQIEELESHDNSETVSELESTLDEVQDKLRKYDSEMDAVNKIFRAIGEAVYSQSKVHI